jgi:hypothetical protein
MSRTVNRIVNQAPAIECLQDVISHARDIRAALVEYRDNLTVPIEGKNSEEYKADLTYLQHQVDVWDRMVDQAQKSLSSVNHIDQVHLSWNEVHKLAVAHVGKPAVYVSSSGSDDSAEETKVFDFIRSSLNNLYGDGSHETIDYMTAIINGSLIFFDTEEEQNKFYRIFDAEITDSSFVYACTYDKTGQCLTENT